MDKILPVYKPCGFSTYDLIRIYKRNYKGKIGHAGTLDPFAHGVVLILLGEATKRFDEIKKWEKTYVAGIKLGSTSTTLDPEGTIKNISSKEASKAEIQNVLNSFIGRTKQKIPMFSAAKHKGLPLYKRALKGEKIEKSKNIEIRDINLLSYRYPFLTIRVFCSGGTYVRQLAQDIGNDLKTGAYLYSLERESVGKFNEVERIV